MAITLTTAQAQEARIADAEVKVCEHAYTRRGGVDYDICDDCGEEVEVCDSYRYGFDAD